MPEPAPRDRQKFGLGETDFVIGHMGAFTAEKGQDVAVAAAALLRSIPAARESGPGGRWPPAKRNVSEIRQGAPNNVIFPGFISDRAAFFAALDLFIMPSRSEAWGLAALEAMAHGVPVIASDVGGLPEIVETGKRRLAGSLGRPRSAGWRDSSGGVRIPIVCERRAKKPASGRGCFPWTG